jgi:hypothetical protein
LAVEPINNRVIVGPQSALAIKQISGARFSWCGKPLPNAADWFEGEVQVRAHGESVTCEAALVDGEMVVRMQSAIESKFKEKVEINPFGKASRAIWSFRLNGSRRDEEFPFDSESLVLSLYHQSLPCYLRLLLSEMILHVSQLLLLVLYLLILRSLFLHLRDYCHLLLYLFFLVFS